MEQSTAIQESSPHPPPIPTSLSQLSGLAHESSLGPVISTIPPPPNGASSAFFRPSFDNPHRPTVATKSLQASSRASSLSALSDGGDASPAVLSSNAPNASNSGRSHKRSRDQQDKIQTYAGSVEDSGEEDWAMDDSEEDCAMDGDYVEDNEDKWETREYSPEEIDELEDSDVEEHPRKRLRQRFGLEGFQGPGNSKSLTRGEIIQLVDGVAGTSNLKEIEGHKIIRIIKIGEGNTWTEDRFSLECQQSRDQEGHCRWKAVLSLAKESPDTQNDIFKFKSNDCQWNHEIVSDVQKGSQRTARSGLSTKDSGLQMAGGRSSRNNGIKPLDTTEIPPMPEVTPVGGKTLSLTLGATYTTKDTFEELLCLAAQSQGWQTKQVRSRKRDKTFKFVCEEGCHWSIELSPFSETSPVSIVSIYNLHNHHRRPAFELTKPRKKAGTRNSIAGGEAEDNINQGTSAQDQQQRAVKAIIQQEKEGEDARRLPRKDLSNESGKDKQTQMRAISQGASNLSITDTGEITKEKQPTESINPTLGRAPDSVSKGAVQPVPQAIAAGTRKDQDVEMTSDSREKVISGGRDATVKIPQAVGSNNAKSAGVPDNRAADPPHVVKSLADRPSTSPTTPIGFDEQNDGAPPEVHREQAQKDKGEKINPAIERGNKQVELPNEGSPSLARSVSEIPEKKPVIKSEVIDLTGEDSDDEICLVQSSGRLTNNTQALNESATKNQAATDDEKLGALKAYLAQIDYDFDFVFEGCAQHQNKIRLDFLAPAFLKTEYSTETKIETLRRQGDADTLIEAVRRIYDEDAMEGMRIGPNEWKRVEKRFAKVGKE